MALTVGGASAIASGVLGGIASQKAAGQAAGAIQQGVDFQRNVYGTEQSNLNPFIQGGTNALAALQQFYGLPQTNASALPGGGALASYKAFTQTPFYQFPLQQGLQSLSASGAARGLTLSGGQENALQKYAQGAASSNFSNYISALSGLANLGQSSATALGTAGNQAASTVLTGQTGIGNALAGGTLGQQNQLNNALGGLNAILGPGQGTPSSYGGAAGAPGSANANSPGLLAALQRWFASSGSATPAATPNPLSPTVASPGVGMGSVLPPGALT